MGKIIIRIYRASTGKEPYREWLEKQPIAQRALIETRLAKLRKGILGDVKKLSGAKGIFELRIHVGPGYRIYFGKDGDRIVLLLCGGIKKSQLRDVEKAKKYLKDYFERG